KATGAQTTDQYLKMSDSVDAYEQQFSEQVKNVKEARSSVNQDLVRTNESKNELTVRSAELRLLVKGVVDDYWINTKNGLKQNITDARATATEAASTATLAKQAADKKLEEDGRSAGAELKEEQLLAAEQLEASAALAKQALIDAGAAAQRKVVVARSEADKQLTESARIARADFDREADRAIREAALAGTARGNEAGASTLKGNDNDSSAAAAAAAVKKVAVEAQERLAKESAETARVNADSAVEAQALAAAAAAAATEQLSSQSRDALLISAENAAAASEKVANAAVSTANRIFERSNEAAEAALSRTLTVNRKTVESVNMGSKLSDLDRELLSVQIQVARYLQLNKQSFVDSALASVDTALAISDQVRRESGDEKVTLQMGEVRKQLIEYQRQFRDVVAESDAVAEALIQANSQIDQQKDQLRQTGEQLLNLATQLSDGAWGEISSQSRELQITGSEAQNLLMVLVVVGVLLGGFVLYAVPRPILAAINQLLMGAQRVAAGDLTQAISVDSRDELGQLATTFDHMRANLMSLVDRIQCASVQISTTVNEIQAASSQQSATSTEQAG
ncbi:MAG: HAMP domain-containing protein, partial [Gammaproteobacteria bacterium]|nr:HAMP domain-containing protein [Gammaproteobacteria bacterium]